MDVWQQAAILTTIPTAALIAVTYILRKLFDRGLQRDLARYTNELELRRSEHLSRVSLLHQNQAKVIGIIYGRLAKAYRLMSQLTHPLQPSGQQLDEKKDRTWNAYYRIDDYFNEHRIYLDVDLGGRIDEILEKIKSALASFLVGQPGKQYTRDETGLWMDSYKEVSRDLPPLLHDLENRFRQLIGSEKMSNHKA